MYSGIHATALLMTLSWRIPPSFQVQIELYGACIIQWNSLKRPYEIYMYIWHTTETVANTEAAQSNEEQANLSSSTDNTRVTPQPDNVTSAAVSVTSPSVSSGAVSVTSLTVNVLGSGGSLPGLGSYSDSNSSDCSASEGEDDNVDGARKLNTWWLHKIRLFVENFVCMWFSRC